MTAFGTTPIVQDFAHPDCCDDPRYNDRVVEPRNEDSTIWRVAGYCLNCETDYCEDVGLRVVE